MNGIATITIQAPFANFVIVTTTRTTPVVAAPIPLITALRCQLPCLQSGSSGGPCPACDSVNAVKTPTT